MLGPDYELDLHTGPREEAVRPVASAPQHVGDRFAEPRHVQVEQDEIRGFLQIAWIEP
jgi:hypothetical protein